MHERSSVVAGAPRICLVPEMTDLPSLVNIKGSPEISSVASGSTRWLVRGAIAVALVVAASWLGYAMAFQRGLDHLRAAAQQRLAVEAARLDGHLSRFEYLPSLLETSPSVFRLLDAPSDPALRQTVSQYLKSINLLAGAENLYVLSVSAMNLPLTNFHLQNYKVPQRLAEKNLTQPAITDKKILPPY